MLLNESNAAATGAIWTRFRADLFRFIRRRVRDDAVAEDLLQEAFERIHRGVDQLSDETRVASWVHTIVRRVIADYYRKERSTEPLEDVGGIGDVSVEFEESIESREHDAANRLIGGWLLAMIDELPEDYRTALQMVEIQGISQAAAAGRLGLSSSGAKSRVQRGRAKLRQTLARCCRVEFDRRGNVLDFEPHDDCC